MTKALGFIGLGVMGFPMAGHLSEHNQIAVFNRTKKKSEILKNFKKNIIKNITS